MSSIVADLHVHTERSDGTIAVDDLAPTARSHGLKAVAITDHDLLPPFEESYRRHAGVTVIGGIELRVDSSTAGRVDILGYGVRPTEALIATVEDLQRDRRSRAKVMIAELEETLDCEIPLQIESGVGRPHIAAAVADVTDLTVTDVFNRYIHDGGPCYVPRDVPSFTEGRDLLMEACELVVLAHPLRYDDHEQALALVAELDGLEYHYPYDFETDPDRLSAFCRDRDLIRTGGSDAHTVEAIGSCGLDADAFDAVADGLALPTD